MNPALCEQCQDAPAWPLHGCPFKETNEPPENVQCNCCEKCRELCEDDVFVRDAVLGRI